MTRSAQYLEAAADREMIRDLLARYAWEIDHGTPEGFASLFVEEGVFEVPDLDLRVVGRERIVEFAKDLQRTLPNIHHVMSNFVIDVSGERARGRCELNEFMARPEAIYPSVQGWYEDEYVLEEETWRIQSRRAFFSGPDPARSGKVAEYSASFFEISAKYLGD